MADELTPITRLEGILAGQDIQPITRLEHFLKQYAGGEGGSGGGSPLIVEITGSDGEYESDKTVDELAAAFEQGRQIFALFQNTLILLYPRAFEVAETHEYPAVFGGESTEYICPSGDGDVYYISATIVEITYYGVSVEYKNATIKEDEGD